MSQKLKMVISIIIFALFIVIALVVYNYLGKNKEPQNNINSYAENESVSDSGENAISAPDFTVQDADGNQVKLSDFKGKPVVLNFWTSWCIYCKKEMPDFETAYKELGDDVQFMMVNVTDGYRETKEMGQEFIQNQGFTFPIYYDINLEGSNAYSVVSLPTTVFIDKDGNVVNLVKGMIDSKVLNNNINLIK